METLIDYRRFYKRHGLRFIAQLRKPPVTKMESLTLPKSSLLHWIDYEGQYEVGPPQSEPLLQRSGIRYFANVITEYHEPLPNYVVVRRMGQQLTTRYVANNPKIFKMVNPVSAYSVPNQLLLFNYGVLNHSVRYRNLIDSRFNQWANYFKTVFYHAIEISKISKRNQFIILDAPKHFPSLSSLSKTSKGISKSNIRLFPYQDHWLVVALWNLLAQNGQDIIFNQVDINDLPSKKTPIVKPGTPDLNTINIIWKFDAGVTVMNLGLFLSWCFGDKASIDPIKLRKRLLRFFIGLKSLGTRDLKNIVIDEEFRDVSEADLDNLDLTEHETFEEESHSNDDEVTEESSEDSEDTDEESSDEDGDEFIENDFLVSPFSKKPELPNENIKAYDERTADEIEDEILKKEGLVSNDETVDDNDENFEQEMATVADSADVEEEVTAYKAYEAKPNDAEYVIEEEGMKLVKTGIMSTKQLQRLVKLSKDADKMKSPYNPKQTIGEVRKVSMEEAKIDESPSFKIESHDILDESMKESKMLKYHEQYLSKMYRKDIVASVMAIQRGGLVVKDYNVERVETLHDNYEIHKVQIETLKGHISTLAFKIPVVDNDGQFTAGGTRRFIRTQRGDIPIRKVSPNEVALTSYYSKMFVLRSERKQFDIDSYIHNEITMAGIENRNGISNVKFGNVFDNYKNTPRLYSLLAKKFISLDINNIRLFFDINKVEHNLGEKVIKGKIPLAIDIKSGKTVLYLVDRQLFNENNENVGTLEELLSIDMSLAPVEYADVNIFGKNIPLVVLLGHQIGLGNLLKTLKVNYRRVPRGSRLNLETDEYPIKFNDEVLILNRNKHHKANLIINGLLRFKNKINNLSIYTLDQKSVYSDLFETLNAPLKLLKETRDMFNLWVDPVTENILLDMKEPTDLFSLFLRAAELLVNDQHPDANDALYMRDKGYDRVAGMVYAELTKAVREYNNKPIYSQSKLTINPETIWYSIIMDQSTALVDDSNPIHSIKEKDVVVYSGSGGRSGQTMTASSRRQHINNVGVISEATVDSGDTGTVIYKSFNPNYGNVYGKIDPVKPSDATSSQLLSSAALLSPGATHDDTKRLGFISVQTSQTTFCDGYTPMPLRTGLEKVVHARSSESFAKVLDRPAKVLDRSEKTILIEYEDGERQGYTIGRKFGKWGGYNIPHDIVSDYKKGDKLKAGDVLFYNKNYFVKDKADKNNITLKNQVLARVGIVENLDVYEDSCALSRKFGEKLGSRLGHIRSIRINSEQIVKNLVKVGDTVEVDSILCTVLSSQLDTGIFNSSAMGSLQNIASINPKAKFRGVVDDIKIIYTAEYEDLPEETKELVSESDARLFKESKRKGGFLKSGKVLPGLMVDGKKLNSDEVVIQVYITEEVDMSVADKIVAANQLKATVGRYWNDEVLSEDGREVDMLFSAKSIDNRIVLSAELIGTTNTLLVALTEAFVKAYDS